MGRKLRIQYPGAMYHVMNRGDHQERIFRDDSDRQLLLSTLAEGCQKTGWQVHSYCLMSNHFHLVIETPRANLVEGMKWFLGWHQPGTGRQFAARMEARRQAELEPEFQPLQRGWCVGSEQFRADMLKYVEEQRGRWHCGAQLWESDQARAERLIHQALQQHGIAEEQIGRWRKGHPSR